MGVVAICLVLGTSADANESLKQTYAAKPVSTVGLVIVHIGLMILNTLIVLGIGALISLHMKLISFDFTAYEYIVYKRDRKERLQQLKDGDIDKATFEYEEEKALSKQGVKKRSKIIREIKQEEKEKAKQRRMEQLEKQGGVEREEMKETSYYYCLSATMCQPCTKRIRDRNGRRKHPPLKHDVSET